MQRVEVAAGRRKGVVSQYIAAVDGGDRPRWSQGWWSQRGSGRWVLCCQGRWLADMHQLASSKASQHPAARRARRLSNQTGLVSQTSLKERLSGEWRRSVFT